MGYFRWAENQLKDLIAQNPKYNRSQFPARQLGMANQLVGSRMPGSAAYGRNVFTSQGNTLGAVERTATDASQALAAAAGVQGQTDQSLSDLQLQEADWQKFGLSNLNQAYGAMADEDRIVEQQKQKEYENLVSLKGAQAANKYAKRKALWNTVGDIGNFALSAASLGVGSGLIGGGGAATGATRNSMGGWNVSGNVRY